jgi:hypothetical protein
MRHIRKFRGDSGHKRILPVRQPKDYCLAQGLGPLFSLDDQASHLVGRGRDQGFGEPDASLGQLADDVERLVTFLGLESIDRENDLGDRGVLLPQDFGVLLTRSEDDLIEPKVSGDRVIRNLEGIRVVKFGLDLRDGPVPRKSSMTDPAEDVPADGPMRESDHAFLFRTLGFGMSRTVAIGAVIELANQLDWPVERIKTSLAMVTDMHHVAAEGTITLDDIELPGSELNVLGPGESHGAALRAVRESEQRDKPSLSLGPKSRSF